MERVKDIVEKWRKKMIRQLSTKFDHIHIHNTVYPLLTDALNNGHLPLRRLHQCMDFNYH